MNKIVTQWILFLNKNQIYLFVCVRVNALKRCSCVIRARECTSIISTQMHRVFSRDCSTILHLTHRNSEIAAPCMEVCVFFEIHVQSYVSMHNIFRCFSYKQTAKQRDIQLTLFKYLISMFNWRFVFN